MLFGYKRVSNVCVIPPENDLSEKTDVWSCGIIMYFLLILKMKFGMKFQLKE